MRCTFCAYGAPDERTVHLGQKTGRIEIPPPTLDRMSEALQAVIDQTEIRHIYLVGGSLTDARKEGERFLQLARFVKTANKRGIPVSLGSGALARRHHRAVPCRAPGPARLLQPRDVVRGAVREGLPGQEPLRRLCALDRGARDGGAALGSRKRLFGDGRRHRARAGARARVGRSGAHRAARRRRSLQPRHHPHLFARLAGRRSHPVRFPRAHPQLLRDAELRLSGNPRRHGLKVSDGFMCHRCAYMQLECDMDRNALVAA